MIKFLASLLFPPKKPRDELLKHLFIFEEDYRNKPYKCSNGFITIGIGHNLEANPVSDYIIDEWYQDDYEKAYKAATDLIVGFESLGICRKYAIIQMAFQIGQNGLSKFIATINAINARDWKKAASQASKSKWATKDSPRRAQRVIYMLEKDELPKEYIDYINGIDPSMLPVMLREHSQV